MQFLFSLCDEHVGKELATLNVEYKFTHAAASTQWQRFSSLAVININMENKMIYGELDNKESLFNFLKAFLS